MTLELSKTETMELVNYGIDIQTQTQAYEKMIAQDEAMQDQLQNQTKGNDHE